MASVTTKQHWEYLNALLRRFSLPFMTSAISFKDLLFKMQSLPPNKIQNIRKRKENLPLTLLILICFTRLVYQEEFRYREGKFWSTMLSVSFLPESPKSIFNPYG